MKIWCVEDDENINNLVTYALESNGFKSTGFTKSEDFLEAIKTDTPDMCILDIMLPNIDGVQLLEFLRKNSSTKNVPVIMLTAKTSEIDKVKALDLGADDYVSKPFGIMELLSRVKAVFRRVSDDNKASSISFKGVTIYHQQRKVVVEDEEVELTLKEYNMLYLFLSNTNQVFTRKQLMDKVWGDSYVGESRTIDMHVKTLRQKLKTSANVIKTVRGVGYKAE